MKSMNLLHCASSPVTKTIRSTEGVRTRLWGQKREIQHTKKNPQVVKWTLGKRF